MGEPERVVGDPTEVLTRSGGSSYVSLTGATPVLEVQTAQIAGGRRSSLAGWLALAVAALAGVLTGVGVALAAGGDFVPGTVVAWVAIALSGVGLVAGIIAVIGRFGRMPGAAAIPLALLANPYLLARLLEVAAAATT